MAGLKRPANISKQLKDLCDKTPPEVLRDRRGYYLERSARSLLEAKVGQRAISVQVSALLIGLGGKLRSTTENEFFDELVMCYSHGAFRATVVMAWNLTYSHLCGWILEMHVNSFNKQWPVRYPELHKKSKVKLMTSLDDFGELKESEVIEIARSAGLFSQGIHRSLIEKLGKRNSAAHPSTHIFSQLQAEEFVYDLITNVVAKLPTQLTTRV